MDVFRIRLNLKNLTFGTIENLNFPYSSTYDDFLYIPVASSEYAYFSTNRNSDIGSLEVVKSKISNKEVPSFVSRLIFHDEINEQITQILKVPLILGGYEAVFLSDDASRFVQEYIENLIELKRKGEWQNWTLDILNQNNINKSSTNLYVSDLNSGLYIVVIKTNKTVITKRLVVQ